MDVPPRAADRVHPGFNESVFLGVPVRGKFAFRTATGSESSGVRRLSCPHLSKLAASFLESAQVRQTFDCELYRPDTDSFKATQAAHSGL